MHNDPIVFSLFLMFAGAAIVATFVLYTRQSLLVAYIVLGGLLGPWGLGWFSDSTLISQVGNIGIIFLLFLLGLHLQPQNLIKMLQKTTHVTLISSLVFIVVGWAIGLAFGFSLKESIIIGSAMMFSSTIIGLKLLPTTILHHQHTGEVMISVLLMQDIIAIIVLLLLHAAQSGGLSFHEIGLVCFALPILILVSFVGANYVLLKLIRKFDRIQEYIFLVSIAWCLSIAVLSVTLNLSAEIGAFIAGVSLATNKVALYIAESLKPLRDFFLVMFFFSIGASFNFKYLPIVILPAIVLAIVIMIVKPIVFKILLIRSGEAKHVAAEVGVRLGQVSEFSLLITYLAASTLNGFALIGETASYLIQATTIITFIMSSYLVVLRYPTPIAVTDKLRRD